jgi:2-polyprenyl-3-methyl-5-hydroxy-6-metoxy-1,4-benzoquinol methylase
MAVLAKEIGEANVICIDITDSNASLCKRYGMDLRICDIQSSPIPIEDKSVDVIFILEVIEHLCMYPSDLLDQIFAKLKSGGYIVISTVNFLRITNRIRVFFGKSPLINFFERTIDGRNHIREFTSDEMAYYIEKSGFKILQKSMFGIPYGTALVSIILRLIYIYPNFRNYFLIIGRKP